jgi:hypothetical protein
MNKNSLEAFDHCLYLLRAARLLLSEITLHEMPAGGWHNHPLQKEFDYMLVAAILTTKRLTDVETFGQKIDYMIEDVEEHRTALLAK